MLRLLFILCLISHLGSTSNNSYDTGSSHKQDVTSESTSQHQSLSSTAKPVREWFNSLSFDNYSDYCTCDLKPKSCDINCCCDTTCSDDERRLFAFCEKIKKDTNDDKYCFRENIIYFNNTQYKMKKTSSGLFCIVWDNAKEISYYPDMPVISSLQEYRKWPLDKTLGWDKDQSSYQPSIHLIHSFRYNDPIWLVNLVDNGVEINEQWSLPFSFLKEGDLCDSFKPIRYLKDDQYSCLKTVKDLRNECVSTSFLSHSVYHQSLFIGKIGSLANIHGVNDVYSSNASVFKPVIKLNSEGYINFANISHTLKPRCLHLNECVEIEIDKNSPLHDISLRLDSMNRIQCLNVIKSVTYIITYDPKDGIEAIRVKFNYTNLTEDKNVRQTFQIIFHSAHQESIDVIQFSGNPGYLFGKPILTRNSSQVLSNIVYYKLPKSTRADGMCSDNHMSHEVVKFGVNTRSGCILNISKFEVRKNVCQFLQKLIINHLDWVNSQYDQIAIYANPKSNNSSDWLPIILDNEAQVIHLETVSELTPGGRCPALVTGYSIVLYYTKIGPQSQPQNKLIGVVKTYHKTLDLSLRCTSWSCSNKNKQLVLSTSITFVDVSNPIHYHFASPPVLKFQLPSDFFYPFLLNNSSSITNQPHILYCSILITTCTLLLFNRRY